MLKGIDFFDQLIHCTDCKSSLGQFDLGYIMKLTCHLTVLVILHQPI